jgi:hypothetical protein
MSFSVHDSVVCEFEGCVKTEVVSEVFRKYDVCVWKNIMFLTPPHQGTTPQFLKLKFLVHTSGQKQKRK